MNSAIFRDNKHSSTNHTWSHSRSRECETPGLPLLASAIIPTTKPAGSNNFIVLLNILFCTDNLHGANVFPLNNIYRGITLSLCLTKKEIRELTLKVHYAAQSRILSEMEIHHTFRPDGSPVVLYSTLSDLIDNPKRKTNQPDFSSLRL